MRILLVKTSSLGDVVHNLPVVSDLLARFPGASIDWVVEEGFAEIPRLHPGVRHIFPVATRRWRKRLLSPHTWREYSEFKATLQQATYDAVLDTQGLLKSALITRLARGPHYGYAAEAAREPLAARFYDLTRAIPKNAHAVDRNRWLAAATFGYAEAPSLALDYGILAPPFTADWLPNTPYAVLLTATSREDKLWAEANWIALGLALKEQGITCVLPGGSPIELARAARIAQAINGIAAPALGITALAGVLGGAQLVVGLDTGLTHLAVALKRPSIAIFSGSEPGLTGVLGELGTPALNLGGKNAPPTAVEVIAKAQSMLSINE